ncbi:MAG: PLP-dependent aminotransferase family protein, partial [Chloroflexota bacterium]|nr:PLP-dependent aminotransferase family protein [Chloroflexota bacterium]
RSVYSERAKTMGSVLLEEFGDIVSFQQPNGGYYFWLKFPEGFDTTSFLPLAEQHGVSFRPGNAFSESGRFASYLRLTYTLFESADLAEGIKRLSTAYRSS